MKWRWRTYKALIYVAQECERAGERAGNSLYRLAERVRSGA